MDRQDTVWQRASVVRTFVDDVRGGVPYALDQIAMMVRVIVARQEPVRRFVDIGCGSGVLAQALRAQYPAAQAALVDFSEPMLDEARRQLAGQAPAPRVVVGDLAGPQWANGLKDLAPFDVAVSAYAIHHLPHDRKRQLYQEVHDLLRPGGMFVNVEHVASATAWVEAISDGLIIDTIHAFQQQRGRDMTRDRVRDDFVNRPDKAANILAPVEMQCDWLRQIGFEDVDCYFKVFELAVFGGRVRA